MKPQKDETPATDAPPPAIPPGTKAKVRIDYETQVNPNQDGRERADLENLLAHADDLETETLPLDELSEFCAAWINYIGYPLSVMRLPDPPERRMPGQAYARPCFNMERVGSTPFDPASLIETLRFVNGNSGGVFRVWLTDYDGTTMIPGAHIQRVAISDPPRGASGTTQQGQQQAQQMQQFQAPTPTPPREKSDSERQLEKTKDELFNRALERALNPPQQQLVSGTPGSNLPPEDQATLFLLSKTDFLSGIFGKMADLAQQSASVTKEPTWKDRAIDAGVELATQNPAIVERLSGVVERIVARILPDPKLDGPYQQQQFQPPFAYAPQTTHTQPPSAEAQPLPEAPDPNETNIGSDDDTMDIVDGLIALLNSDKPLELSDPLFKHMQQAYPLKFKFAIRMIIKSDLETIVDWIKLTGGAPYVILLEGHGGAYVIERMAELQKLIIAADTAAREKNANTQTTSEQTPGAPEVKS